MNQTWHVVYAALILYELKWLTGLQYRKEWDPLFVECVHHSGIRNANSSLKMPEMTRKMFIFKKNQWCRLKLYVHNLEGFADEELLGKVVSEWMYNVTEV